MNTQTCLSAQFRVHMDTRATGIFQFIVFVVDASAGGRCSPEEGSQGRVLNPYFHDFALLQGLDCRMRSPSSYLDRISEIVCVHMGPECHKDNA